MEPGGSNESRKDRGIAEFDIWSSKAFKNAMARSGRLKTL